MVDSDAMDRNQLEQHPAHTASFMHNASSHQYLIKTTEITETTEATEATEATAGTVSDLSGMHANGAIEPMSSKQFAVLTGSCFLWDSSRDRINTAHALFATLRFALDLAGDARLGLSSTSLLSIAYALSCVDDSDYSLIRKKRYFALALDRLHKSRDLDTFETLGDSLQEFRTSSPVYSYIKDRATSFAERLLRHGSHELDS